MIKKIIPDGPRPDNSTPLTYKNNGITVIGPANTKMNISDGFEILKYRTFVAVLVHMICCLLLGYWIGVSKIKKSKPEETTKGNPL